LHQIGQDVELGTCQLDSALADQYMKSAEVEEEMTKLGGYRNRLLWPVSSVARPREGVVSRGRRLVLNVFQGIIFPFLPISSDVRVGTRTEPVDGIANGLRREGKLPSRP